MNAMESILLLLPLSATGTYIDCTNGVDSDCHRNVVDCSTSDVCNVECGGSEGCSYSNIYCPASCGVTCDGPSACISAHIHLPAKSDGSTIDCQGEKACQSSSITIGSDSRVSMGCSDGNDVCNHMHVNATAGGSTLDITAYNFRTPAMTLASIVGGTNTAIIVVCEERGIAGPYPHTCSGLSYYCLSCLFNEYLG